MGLSKPEAKIIHTPTFQRLRNVRQLGLTHYVYPSAEYSRFTHSIGTCHIAGRLLNSLRMKNKNLDISEDEIQLYRLAALLHDIGHYPFSHTMENIVSNYYNSQKIKSNSHGNGHSTQEYYSHERLGRKIILKDPAINKVLDSEGISAKSIAELLRPRGPEVRLSNILNSDLDADRIDYLLRTAHLTALPYGLHDINYLISQVNVGGEKNRLCLSYKALTAADHFLLSRYFQYKQIIYHKTVTGVEKIFQDLIAALLDDDLDCTKSAILEMIASNSLRDFDDHFILEKIRQIRNNDKILKIKADSILYRQPPKEIVSYENLGTRDHRHGFASMVSELENFMPKLAKKYNIPEDLWEVVQIPMNSVTTMGSSVPISSMIDPSKRDYEQFGRSIFIKKDSDEPRPIMEMDTSLMKVLSDQYLYVFRLYVLFPDDVSLGKREDIRQYTISRLQHIPFI